MEKLELTDEFEDTLLASIQTVECDEDDNYKGLSIGVYGDSNNALLNKKQVEELIEYLQKAKEKLPC